MSWALCTSGAALYKAGANASSTVTASGAILDEFSDMAEATVCAVTRKDWVADIALQTANFKPVLADVTSDLIAMKIINYDMSGFTSRIEVQTMLDVLKDNSTRTLEVLKLDETKKVMD